MEIENYILNDSSNSGTVDAGGATSKPAANESRGEWGNVWK